MRYFGVNSEYILWGEGKHPFIPPDELQQLFQMIWFEPSANPKGFLRLLFIKRDNLKVGPSSSPRVVLPYASSVLESLSKKSLWESITDNRLELSSSPPETFPTSPIVGNFIFKWSGDTIALRAVSIGRPMRPLYEGSDISTTIKDALIVEVLGASPTVKSSSAIPMG
ncbi:hypothetical protein LIER_36828 [Lithospermum erythrorhizon]|uniref:Uncharacterized protein n=1 Tax=Lithospermum erythrorhizon TaxID=34254 RepID=A0AAV3PB37_LITER